MPTLSKTDPAWTGFRFTAYWLRKKNVWSLPLTERRTDSGRVEEVQTTVGQMYELLAARQQDEMVDLAPSFNKDVLMTLLSLRRDGINALGATWFLYDMDTFRDEPHQIYAFFVVHQNKVVREQETFSDTLWNNFDPSIFEPMDQIRTGLTVNQTADVDAEIRFWYRKFYTETQSGQIMALRRDKPTLHNYEIAPNGSEPILPVIEKSLNLLGKIHNLLWLLIVLAGLILIRILA